MRRTILQRFSEVEPETLRWLWNGRIPTGMLTVVSGSLAGVRSNDPGDIRVAFSPLVQRAEEFDVAIVFVHDNRKDNGEPFLGATLRQSADRRNRSAELGSGQGSGR